MEFIDVTDGILVVDPFPVLSTEQVKEGNRDKIFDTARKNPNKTYMIVSNDGKVNQRFIAELLSDESCPNIEAAPNILAELGELDKIRKSYIKRDFDKFLGNINDRERAIDLLELIIEDISEGRYSKVGFGTRNNIFLCGTAGKTEAEVRYGKPRNDNDFAINNYLYVSAIEDVKFPSVVITNSYHLKLFKPFCNEVYKNCCYTVAVEDTRFEDSKEALTDVLRELGLQADSDDVVAADIIDGDTVCISVKWDYIKEHITDSGEEGIVEFKVK